MTVVDRYRQVGLTGNPFSVQFGQTRIADGDGAWFVDRGIPDPPPPGAGVLVQLIGDRGLGKSTHLARWRRRSPGPYHYIPRRPYRDRWNEPPLGDLVYGDEIDRMPRLLRYRWLRRLGRMGATVVIGTHRDLCGLGRWCGFEVRTHHLAPLNVGELTAVLERRLQAAAVAPGHRTVAFDAADIARILATSGGNPRAVDDICHRLLAERVGPAGSCSSGQATDSADDAPPRSA